MVGKTVEQTSKVAEVVEKSTEVEINTIRKPEKKYGKNFVLKVIITKHNGKKPKRFVIVVVEIIHILSHARRKIKLATNVK